jgi:hypothetical protein
MVLSVVLISAFVASAALAGNQNRNRWQKSKRFSVMGEVTAVDPSALTLSLDIEKANRLMKAYIGQEVAFVVSPSVKVKTEGTDPGVFDLTLEDVQAGDTIRALGWRTYDPAASDYIYTITHIVVFVDDEPAP